MTWTETDAFHKLGYIIACMMGFAAMYFGYGYDGPPEDWPHYDPKMAEKVC